MLNIQKLEDGSFLIITNKAKHFSRTIIITAGVGAFKPKKLDHENAKDFETYLSPSHSILCLLFCGTYISISSCT
ncbi:hypothetical protein [Bacillus salipaludis]|uniref:Uncharacterized protein n=1 Tax=Bacillus salipaludis TaxID=2547811 RepID=A0ABW8RDN3_9BACI